MPRLSTPLGGQAGEVPGRQARDTWRLRFKIVWLGGYTLLNRTGSSYHTSPPLLCQPYLSHCPVVWGAQGSIVSSATLLPRLVPLPSCAHNAVLRPGRRIIDWEAPLPLASARGKAISKEVEMRCALAVEHGWILSNQDPQNPRWKLGDGGGIAVG
jgi:hypothetical protein